MTEAVIVDALRTPVGRKKGSLSQMHPVDMLVPVLRELVDRNNIEAGEVEDVATGCVTMIKEQGGNIGRQAVLAAGFPVEVPAYSLNRMCGSSQQSLNSASQQIIAGDADVAIACGVENMTTIKMGTDMGKFSKDLTSRFNIVPQGLSAEMIAKKWKLEREELDEFSLESHQRAAKATDNDAFNREIIPMEVETEDGKQMLDQDEGIRRNTSMEKLAGLTPSFQPKDGVVTAGNASQMSDGASGVLLMSREKAEQTDLKPRARVIARAVVGEDPVIMLTGIIPATRKVLKRAGLTLDDMDAIEVNEAFASVVKAWEREFEPDMSKVNPRGGAIALGHPLGASGTKLTASLLHYLEDTGGKYGLQVMCIGFGMATATIIERL
ncbi:thiolase family protein [Salicibibacter halophilus]|uniref:Thiolase family protein n=1 Tax=Salicibibacter halophilus TaxID=2502791 RepID=A0A514LJL8_9BACI|nr:thiolase family protein [Salicibibacter halophilus]QDI92049.1 thiolase family protein [Salicibibacter halophilus]